MNHSSSIFHISVLCALIAVVNGQSSSNSTAFGAQNGNCVSQTFNFNSNRIYASSGPNDPYIASATYPGLYDFTIDYGSQNVKPAPGGGVETAVVQNRATNVGFGTRLSTTRFINYGKITAKMRAVAVPGIVTTFITMSERKDEIDWEFVGGKRSSGETNIFYKGILEFQIRSETITTGPIDQSREYSIDWNRQRIIWSINGNEVRTYALSSPNAVTSMTPPGERSYPSSPAQVQIGVWDGGSSSSAGTSQWAGGPVPWASNPSLSAVYESITIQCYDSNDNPVPKWPLDARNPDMLQDPPNQTRSSDRPNQAAGSNGAEGAGGQAYQVPAIAQVAGLPSLPSLNDAIRTATSCIIVLGFAALLFL